MTTETQTPTISQQIRQLSNEDFYQAMAEASRLQQYAAEKVRTITRDFETYQAWQANPNTNPNRDLAEPYYMEFPNLRQRARRNLEIAKKAEIRLQRWINRHVQNRLQQTNG